MKWIANIFFFLVVFNIQAQVSFTTEVSREKLGINERLKVDFIIDKDADNFKAPDFVGFKRLAGPNQSIEQRYEYGKATFKKTYTYYLQPEKRGNLEIGQAEVEYGGKVYKSPPKTVEVTAAVDNPNSPTSIANSEVSDAIHLVAEVSKSRPYLNEGVYIVYKLYVDRNVNIRNYRPIDEPSFNDFWSQNIDIDRLEFKEGEYGGIPYRYVELRKTILYPQKTGELKVEPLTIGVSVEVPTNRRDIFGRRQYQLVEKTFSANTKVFDVKALPEEGKPVDFTGAVGDFNIQLIQSKSELNANESLSATLKISGNGNLKLFNPPKLKVPNSIELYEPERIDNVNTNAYGMNGYISEKYTLVPQFEGDYSYGGVSFSYFDPRTEKYKTLTTNTASVKVNRDPSAPIQNQPQANTSQDSSSQIKQQVLTPDNQFKYIELKTKLEPKGTQLFFKSNLFWLYLLLPYLCILLLMLIKKRVQKGSGASSRNQAQQKANKLAKKFLSEAKRNIKDQDKFYASLELALHNFLKAKLKITTSEMSKEKIMETLKNRSVGEEQIQRFIKLLEGCELARYAPSSSAAKEEDYKKAAQTISEMDKAL
jgi:hypothetical protein